MRMHCRTRRTVRPPGCSLAWWYTPISARRTEPVRKIISLRPAWDTKQDLRMEEKRKEKGGRQRGREAGTQGGREAGRQGGREAREAESQRGREGGRQRGREKRRKWE